MPRIDTCAVVKKPLLMSMLGTAIWISMLLLIRPRSRSFWVNALTAIAVSCRVVSRFSAVTITSSRLPWPKAPAGRRVATAMEQASERVERFNIAYASILYLSFKGACGRPRVTLAI